MAIQPAHMTVPATEQYYLNVPAVGKLQALTQVLESETIRAVLIFVRTKVGATHRTRPARRVGRATGDRPRLNGLPISPA